jgi:hypothetical protein
VDTLKLAAMIALTWGFAVVLWAAAAAYGLAGVVVMSHNSSSTLAFFRLDADKRRFECRSPS